ncbi:MAG: hypothetical protein JWM57_2828, partial [Phycisphaerales bacterium]|nr:hypothetical protein [Phycisphaerales bacterium]
PDGDLEIGAVEKTDDTLTLHVNGTTMGQFRATMTIVNRTAPMIRWQTWLTPAADLLMPPQPWNVYPLDHNRDPIPTRGIVYAAQRGSAMGCLYFSITEPRAGTALYLQNLTALNDYCEQTQTVPDGIVESNWPGMGYLPPPSDRHSLAKGREVSLCDAFLCLWADVPTDNRQSARRFLDGVAAVYPHLDAPQVEYRDWPAMAAATVRDLTHSSKLSVEEQGYLYLHPYTSSEYPDSMVQLSVVVGLREYERFTGKPLPLTARLREAVPNFFDPKIGILRRYLATVGPDKKADQSDSWYVYHPLMNLARLALAGDEEAKQLFLKSVPFAVRVARHFEYLWPVMFDLKTLEVLTENRKPGEGGQTDVGGLYAYVMLQAFDLTGDATYVDEAAKAVRAIADLGFTVGYQFNNVAWGMVACLRLFKQTGDRFFLEQADLFFASFMHNVNLWECELGAAKHYRTFMGVTCLHDGPYMAAYEEFEAYAAFHEALDVAGDDLPRSSLVLMTEYCRHALDRAWYFYPSTLPPEILATEVRNGHIDRSLAIPLEDLYASREAPGTVGQEVYGSGMAMTLLSRSHHRVGDAPFELFCEYPLRDVKKEGGRQLTFRVWGDADYRCTCRLLLRDGQPVPTAVRAELTTGDRPAACDLKGNAFIVPGGGRVTLRW